MGGGGGMSTFRKREIILAGSGGNQQGNIREKVKGGGRGRVLTFWYQSRLSRGSWGSDQGNKELCCFMFSGVAVKTKSHGSVSSQMATGAAVEPRGKITEGPVGSDAAEVKTRTTE